VIVPVKNVDALVAAIDTLLRSPQARAELGARGQQRIDESFCWHVCARQMTDYYRQVLANADR
jgi:glycosyltransferase involved in cell wall biosynthesis